MVEVMMDVLLVGKLRVVELEGPKVPGVRGSPKDEIGNPDDVELS